MALKKLLIIFSVLLPVLWLTGCQPSQKNDEIVTGEINGVTYYIPEDYFAHKALNYILDNTFSLRVVNPDFAPLMISLEELRARNQRYREIGILAKFYPKLPPADEVINKAIDRLHASKLIGEEYGFLHFEQPEEYSQDQWDVWLEQRDGKSLSYATCSNATYIKVPQCRYHLYRGKFHIQIDFDMRLLPELQSIRANTLALIDSFQSPESAQTFLDTARAKQASNPL